MALRLRYTAPLLLGFVLLAMAMIATFAMAARQHDTAAAVEQSIRLRASLNGALSTLQDAETGQRGYLLSGDTAYLAPYLSASKRLAPQLDEVGRLTANNPRQQALLQQLRALAQRKLAELDLTVGLARGGDIAGAIATMRTGLGKTVMDQARAAIDQMQAEEARTLARRERTADASALLTREVIAAALLLVAILAAVSSHDNWRRVNELERSADALKSTNLRLVEEAAARAAVEEQLRQSQKMEAVGQLTGGLAHDFNNTLAIIIGSLDLMQGRLARGDAKIDHLLANALDAAGRAATLTHRLLAFSRQQPLAPLSVNPNKLVAGMSEMLRGALGGNVVVETVLAGGLWRMNADASQLESAILNLAVNARDAMPDGGRLTIETANAHLDDAAARQFEVPAGHYLLLAVSDTGSGMTPDTVAKAFDPFFTTKPVGQGTGLGLSQVHGFVRQSGGHVRIYSEPGQGTTIKMYFPRLTADSESEDPRPVAVAGMLTHGRPDRIILVVEDEARVRDLTVEALRDLNYTVLHATSAAEALDLLGRQPKIDMLFTDIVMPDMNGRQLAQAALIQRPELKILYTTGYTRNAIVHNGVLDAGLHFIGKPFTLDQLARKVSEVLAA